MAKPSKSSTSTNKSSQCPIERQKMAEQKLARAQRSRELLPSIAQFWRHGYVLIKSAIAPKLVAALLDNVHKLKYKSIFQTVFSDKFDKYRVQADFPEKIYKPFHDVQVALRNTLIRPANMKWVDESWVVLKSLPGGGDQDPHRDFTSADTTKARKLYQTIQAGVLIGLMPNTHITVYDGCFSEADVTKRVKVVYGPGDVVLFRGDLAHSGDAFDDTNYRVHTNLIVPGMDWDQDATEWAPPKVYVCRGCAKTFDNRRQMNSHWRSCAENPQKEEIYKLYKQRNDQGGTCPYCGTSFAKRNTMTVHRKKCANGATKTRQHQTQATKKRKSDNSQQQSGTKKSKPATSNTKPATTAS